MVVFPEAILTRLNSELSEIQLYNGLEDLAPLRSEMIWDEIENLFQATTELVERRAQSKLNNFLLLLSNS